MAKRKRKATLHSANRVTEAELLESARALAADPDLAAPHYEGGFLLFNPVLAARKGVHRAHAAREDKEKLERMAARGNEFVKAYAATLLVAKAEKLPFVADLRLPDGNIPYVIRGSAKPFYLAGLQHYHDRALRLLAVAGWVKKRGLHFYSADRGIVCAGKKDAPPRDFVEEEMDRLDLEPSGPDAFTCGHDGDAEGVLLRWTSANATAFRCLACGGDENTLHHILKHIAAPKPSRAFEPSAKLRPLRAIAGGDAAAPDVTLPDAILQAYRGGRIRDRDLVEAARAARTTALRATAGRLYVAGDASYGADLDAFVAALQPNDVEARALAAALDAHDAPVILDKATVARALHELWPQHGLAMLSAAARGDEAAAQAHHKAAPAPDEVADLVRRAARDAAARTLDSELPKYSRLPPAAETADLVARAYRGEGREAAIRTALDRAAAGKGKGVALALLTALGGSSGQDWRFASSDQDVAASLQHVVPQLLEGDPSGYHEAVTLASRLSGETTTFAPR